MTPSPWPAAITAACADPDPIRANRTITLLHYQLSQALAHHLPGCPNFHTWAVWGSRKAGVSIRQEDLGSAIRNATVTAGLTGAVIGIAAALVANSFLTHLRTPAAILLGIALGALTGALTGRRIAIWSRARAAALILAGNKTVLDDIGHQSARFLTLLDHESAIGETSPFAREAFFSGLRPGPTEQHGQDRLAAGFRSMLAARDSATPIARRDHMIDANCAIVFHEHIRLEPYIRSAMPFIVRRCATQRLMTFDVGYRTLTVGADVPGASTPTAAHDWTHIEDRMRYVFALFRHFHATPEVFQHPFPESQP